MREPGGLSHLREDGAAAWTRRLNDCFDGSLERFGPNTFIGVVGDPRATELTAPDWTGLPARVTTCLTNRRALPLLDWPADERELGGRWLHEEYLEWRVVHGAGGVRRVEITTELAAYWEVLAAYEPQLVLDLVAEFACERAVAPAAIYGSCDPFAPAVTAKQRGRAFTKTMLQLPGMSPYSNGRKAICCLVQPTNRIEALTDLAVASTAVRLIADPADGPLRCLICSEAIPLTGTAAQLGRCSDPVLVERLGRLAYEGRLVAFDDPVGVYIQDVEYTRLRTPFGDQIPREWFSFSRGEGRGQSTDGRCRYQRLTLEVPAAEGYCVSDLVDVATEQQIRYGGQIADLVQLVVFLRVSAPGQVPTDLDKPVELAALAADPRGCTEVRLLEERFGGAPGKALER